MPVTVATQRDHVVTFSKQFGSYYAGEVAAFTTAEAAQLSALGSGAATVAAPKNIDIPYVSLAGSVASCTMGNWTGSPTTYAYQWKSNGVNVGTNAATYTTVGGDSGHTITCVVTATNATGSTPAPPSNGVTAALAAREAETEHPPDARRERAAEAHQSSVRRT